MLQSTQKSSAKTVLSLARRTYVPTSTIDPTQFTKLAPFTLAPDRCKERQETSAPGTRQPGSAHLKFRDDPSYNAFKALTGFNTWAEMPSVNDPVAGLVKDLYVKNDYVRDESGEATMPKRFANDIDYAELQSYLQKADHHFFASNPNPVIQYYVPLQDPRITDPNSQLSKAVTKFEKSANKPKNTQQYDEDRLALKNEDDVFKLIEEEVDAMYKQSTEDEIMEQSTKTPGTRLYNTSLTAQQRRAEFWRKYLDLFKYNDVLHTCTVRCTRSIGRVPQTCALIILGNSHGIFSYGRGKANTFEMAVRRAVLRSRRNVLFVPMHEDRAPYYRIVGKWKQSKILLIPQHRGVGIRAGRLTFTLLRAVGFKDASLSLIGRKNMWNMIRAYMECLKYQESYREVAFARGAHYQVLMDPFVKNPPPPSPDEIQDLEDNAAKAFRDAVKTVFENRQLLNTESFKELRPHFELRDNFESRWVSFLESKNVPKSLHMYPPFSEYFDAAKAVPVINARLTNIERGQMGGADMIEDLENKLRYEEPPMSSTGSGSRSDDSELDYSDYSDGDSVSGSNSEFSIGSGNEFAFNSDMTDSDASDLSGNEK